MPQYHKMTNAEVLRLQEALGSYRSHFGPIGKEMGLLVGCLIFGVFENFEGPVIYITAGLALLLICLTIYRYQVDDRAKKKAMRKDLIHLEKEELELTLQYKTIEEESDRYCLIAAGTREEIPVDRRTYDALQPGQRLRLSRSRYAQIVVGHEKLAR